MAKWEEQLARAKRYYERFKQINDGTAPAYESAEWLIDDVYSFFVHCFHVKDYIRVDKEYKKANNSDVAEYVKKTHALAICEAMRNGIKHLGESRESHKGSRAKIGRRIFHIGPIDRIEIELVDGVNTHDAFDIATKAITAWDAFVK